MDQADGKRNPVIEVLDAAFANPPMFREHWLHAVMWQEFPMNHTSRSHPVRILAWQRPYQPVGTGRYDS